MMNLDRVAAGLSRIGMNVETKTGEDGKQIGRAHV